MTELAKAVSHGIVATELRGTKVTIFGGSGFVGRRIVQAFAMAGASRIVVLDAAEWVESNDDPPQLTFMRGSITNAADVSRAMSGADVVVHLASYGMSGAAMLDWRRIEDVNIRGTQRIIEACEGEHNVTALVYASSYNAVFHGQRITNAAYDAVDYPPDDSYFKDHYSWSKSHAERLVRIANCDESGNLKTAALRLAAIHGPGEERHFPRIVKTMKAGMLAFTVGGMKPKVDWVYVDNVAYAFCLTAARLRHEWAAKRVVKSPLRQPLGGTAMPISDHHPINQWEMLGPLFDRLRCRRPSMHIPVGVMLRLAQFLEFIHGMTSWIVRHDPFCTQGEVLKVGVEHYFNGESVEKGPLGYAPIVPHQEGVDRTFDAIVKADRRHGVGGWITMRRQWVLLLSVCAALFSFVLYIVGAQTGF